MNAEGFLVEQATSADVPGVDALIQGQITSLKERYGAFDVPSMIDLYPLTLTVKSGRGMCWGFAAFVHAPIQADGVETVQLALLATDRHRGRTVAQAIMDKCLNLLPTIDRIIAVVGLSHPLDPALSFLHEQNIQGLNDVKVFAVNRGEAGIGSRLIIREAREEDHDDLVPIFNSQSQINPEVHEKFFLARIIEEQDANNRALVAVDPKTGKPMGMCCLSIASAAQLAELRDDFDLSDFPDIIPPTENLGTRDSGGGEGKPDAYSSCVAVTLFCLDATVAYRGCDFIKPAFELFPGIDYIILTQPYSSPATPFHSHFYLISPLLSCSKNEEAWCVSFNVRKARSLDYDDVLDLLPASDEKLVHDYFSEDYQGPLQTFVGISGGRIVGAAIVEALSDQQTQWLREHYALDNFFGTGAAPFVLLPPEHCLMHSTSVLPNYRSCLNRFLSGIIRDKACIFRQVYPKKPCDPALHRLFSLAPPRRQILSLRDAPNSNPYALYLATPRLIYLHHSYINTQIVVVGASTVGISFLDSLLKLPLTKFVHLVLVSPGGLPDPEYHPMSIDVGHMQPCARHYHSCEYESSALYSSLHVVDAKLVAIEREAKLIRLSNDAVITYDILVLSTGLLSQPGTLAGPGVFPLSTQGDETAIVDYYRENSPTNVLIVGQNLNAFCAVQGILSLGVKGSRITVVFPPNEQPFSSLKAAVAAQCFAGDECVAEKALSLLQILEVQYVLDRIPVVAVRKDGKLRAVVLQSAQETRKQECDMMILCCFHDVDPSAFKAVNDACITYDGRLVIDKNYRANDPSIFAAGTLTKFGRKEKDRKPLWAFNSREVGTRLAQAVLYQSGLHHLIDVDAAFALQEQAEQFLSQTIPPIAPGLLPHGDDDEEPSPGFGRSKTVSAILPGGIRYFHSHLPILPGQSIPKGDELITADTHGDSYFRLYITERGIVHTVTCLSKQCIEIDNLMCLVGLHHRFLNNIVERHSSNLIEDLFQFFRENWSMAIFHDRFLDLRYEFTELLGPRIKEFLATVEGMKLEDYSRKKDAEELKKEVQLLLFDFLSEHSSQLDMYLLPPGHGEISQLYS